MVERWIVIGGSLLVLVAGALTWLGGSTGNWTPLAVAATVYVGLAALTLLFAVALERVTRTRD